MPNRILTAKEVEEEILELSRRLGVTPMVAAAALLMRFPGKEKDDGNNNPSRRLPEKTTRTSG